MVTRRGLLTAGATGAAALTVGRTFSVETADAAATGDGSEIQAKLDAAHRAGGGQVLVGPGTWTISQASLRIYRNTRLTSSPGTVYVRTGAITSMLSNGPRDGSDTTTKAYDGEGNIVVEGGIWNANATSNTKASWGIVFGHCRDITIRDLEVRDVPDWHAIELNSTYNALVQNCRFVDGKNSRSDGWNVEALSIDMAAPGLPPFGAGDNTQSQLIRIVENYCENWQTFTGAHTGYVDANHEQFIVAHNTMRNLEWWGISLRNVSRAVVSDNSMHDVEGGIWIRPHVLASVPEARPITDVVIANNVVDTTTGSDAIRLIGEAPSAAGTTADGRIYGATVTGNTIRNAKLNGLVVTHAPGAVVTGNAIRGAGRSGIAMSYDGDQTLGSNLVQDAGQATDATADAIRITGASTANIQGNKVVSTPGARRSPHAISCDAASKALLCTNNDLRGWGSAALDLQGTGHITTAANAT